MSDPLPACRSCGAVTLEPLLSLGRQPLANALRTTEQLGQPEPTYPLDLVFCPRCTLVQITETVPPEILFREYFYFSSFSTTFLEHAERLARRLVVERRLGPESLVAEVASNDGYLLQYYRSAGVPVLGIEPATNIAEWATRERGIPTINEFFSAELARRLRDEGKAADVIHAHNVLAHVADLNGVVEGFHTLLKDDGIVVVEAPYLKDTIDHCEFDQIYHEHLCYFSLTAFKAQFERHGLVIVDVERLPIHGGSIRVKAGRAAGRPAVSEAVTAILAEEKAWGVDKADVYQNFARRVDSLKADLRRLLSDLKAQGKRIAAYGASAKGSTLLNYFDIGRETLEFVADRSTVKQGRYTPGTALLIVAPEALVERMPDYTLLLSWNFADEILAQQQDYHRRGGRFIVPIPELKILPAPTHAAR
jgi:SAM-dependent methyltransferase